MTEAAVKASVCANSDNVLEFRDEDMLVLHAAGNLGRRDGMVTVCYALPSRR